jgi:hypothetical protein
MGLDKLQNISDLDSQEILRDLYFNSITSNPLKFWKGVKKSPYYSTSKEIVKINMFLINTNGVRLFIEKDLQTDSITLKESQQSNKDKGSIRISSRTKNLIKQNQYISTLFDQDEIDKIQIQTFRDEMKKFDKYVSAVLTAQTIEIEEKRLAITQFIIPIFTLLISIFSLIFSYYSLKKGDSPPQTISFSLSDLIQRFFPTF